MGRQIDSDQLGLLIQGTAPQRIEGGFNGEGSGSVALGPIQGRRAQNSRGAGQSAAMSDPAGPMKYRVEGETEIDAAADAVWEVLSDFHAVDTWAARVTRVRPLGEVPRGLGMARHCDIRRLGGVDEVVNVWEEGRRLGYSVTPVGPIGASQSLWEIEPLDPRSARVKLRLDYQMRFGPIGALLHALLVRRLLVRNLPGALALLKRRVETGRTVRPASPAVLKPQ